MGMTAMVSSRPDHSQPAFFVGPDVEPLQPQ